MGTWKDLKKGKERNKDIIVLYSQKINIIFQKCQDNPRFKGRFLYLRLLRKKGGGGAENGKTCLTLIQNEVISSGPQSVPLTGSVGGSEPGAGGSLTVAHRTPSLACAIRTFTHFATFLSLFSGVSVHQGANECISLLEMVSKERGWQSPQGWQPHGDRGGGLVASLLNRSGSELSEIQAPAAQSEKQEPSIHENLKRKIV